MMLHLMMTKNRHNDSVLKSSCFGMSFFMFGGALRIHKRFVFANTDRIIGKAGQKIWICSK